jgi:hypothetical protein
MPLFRRRAQDGSRDAHPTTTDPLVGRVMDDPDAVVHQPRFASLVPGQPGSVVLEIDTAEDARGRAAYAALGGAEGQALAHVLGVWDPRDLIGRQVPPGIVLIAWPTDGTAAAYDAGRPAVHVLAPSGRDIAITMRRAAEELDGAPGRTVTVLVRDRALVEAGDAPPGVELAGVLPVMVDAAALAAAGRWAAP